MLLANIQISKAKSDRHLLASLFHERATVCSEEGSYVRLVDFCIIQLLAAG